MFELENLKDLEDEILRCSRCGTCRATCPVFKETGQETMVSRGRLEIIESILKKKIDFSEYASLIIDSCLLCGSCYEGCPGKIRVDEIVRMARRDRMQKQGLSYTQEFIFRYILENRSLFGLTIDMAFYFQQFFTRKSSFEHMRHLPLFISGISKGRLIPKLSPRRLSSMFPKVITPTKRKLKVGFFPGCLIEYVYTDTGKSIIEILLKNDIEVVIPPKQQCCGIGVLASGEEKTSRRLALNNVTAFLSQDFDAIITACASCGTALKHEYPILLKDANIDVAKFSAKVKDISEFLVNYTSFEQKLVSNTKFKVTYHDPCHLKRKQKIFTEPRKILRSIDNVSFVEMPQADACCGGGGSFSLYFYEIANKIRNRKIINIESTEADYVATSCPGCIMHIQDGLIQKGSKIETIHVVDMLNKMTK